MGELRRKGIFWVFGVGVFLFLLTLGGRYAVQKIVQDLKVRYNLNIAVERVTPLFLGLSFEGVTLQGEGFSFRASRLLARLSWTKGISLVMVDGECSFSRALSSIPLESLPPFFLEIRRSRLVGLHDFLWNGWLEKRGDLLRFRGVSRDLSVGGTIRGSTVAFSGTYRGSPFQGTFSLEDKEFSGEFGEMYFEGTLFSRGQTFEVSPFLVRGKGVEFSGKCTLGEDASFLLSGVACAFGKEFPLTLSGRIVFPVLEGDLQSSGLSGHLRVDLDRASFALSISPHSVWQGVHVSGGLEGSFQDGVTLELQGLSVNIPQHGVSFVLAGRLRGEDGELRGDVELQRLKGKVGTWEFEGKALKAYLGGQSIRFSGTGALCGGRVVVSGEYRGGKLDVRGKIENVALGEMLEENVPLSGTLSGNLSLSGELGNLEIVLALTGGRLFFREVDFGQIVSGEVVYKGGTVVLRNILLAQGNGKFLGTVTRDSSGIWGEGVFEAYPLAFPWEGKNVQLLLKGKVAFQWGKERSFLFALSAPLWSFGTLRGWNLDLVGEVRGKEVRLERFSTLWDGGLLSVQGNLVAGEKVDLQGEVENLRIPENDFRVSGIIEKARLLVSGSWENATWEFEGEGSSLRIGTEPLGERITLKLSGKVSPARLLQDQPSILDILHPGALEEGTIAVHGANLALFGGEILSRVSGTFDMYFTLDTQKNLWRFHSGALEFSFPPYGNFEGMVRGTYDGRCFVVEHVELKGDQGVHLSGGGTVDTVARDVDLRVRGRVRSFFPLGEFGVNLEAEGEIRIFGDWVSPGWEGSLRIQKVEVSGKDGAYLVLENLQGKLLGNLLQFSGYEGTFPGGRITKIEGEISPGGCAISGSLEGESLPGFEGVFEGRWKGQVVLSGENGRYTLEGDFVVAEASFDTRRGRFRGISDSVFWPKFPAKLPISVKLHINLQDTLIVRTDFLYLVLSGGMSLNFDNGKPSLNGRFDVLQGVYDLVACTVPLEGYISFTDFGGYTPQLHLEGQKSVAGYDIRVRISGPLSGYVVDFSSEPPLSKEEVLSLLFLGDKDAYMAIDRVNLSPLLAKMARFFLKKDFSLQANPLFDAITFDPEDFSRITLEKRLGKNVTMGYTQDLNGGSAFEVNVDFSKEWSFRFEREESGEMEWMLQFTTKF